MAFDLNEVSAAVVCSLTDRTLFSDEKKVKSLGFTGGKNMLEFQSTSKTVKVKKETYYVLGFFYVILFLLEFVKGLER